MFSRSLYCADPSFTPLFRLLEDFDNYSRDSQSHDTQNGSRSSRNRAIRTFTPKFDISESAEAYELHGELPGIAREDLSIEFTDPQTIVIKGKVERTRTAGTPPAGLLENNGQASNVITESGEEQHSSHKATVEDEKPEDEKNTTVAKTGDNKEVAYNNKPKQPEAKFWLQERSIGEFSRTFSFPSRVEHEGVKAGLDNGILTVVVPKARKPQVHKVQIH
ncbi:putative 30 kDa heat shock protein [Triangularia verruculosa]|uniref:30 kDa heat shock protein n=1 Tax=Triangularia verruculosa TaxID=2587418 RepID=A0AAN7ASH2_9PEZI|nr:putative 30 kDa heat shock protein [Triangularia verruculosa]